MILIRAATRSSQPVGGLTPPRQRRSERTLDRLLAAAAAMLETRSFDELSVAELVTAAGTSVGAFYGRFEDKDAFFETLHRRFLDCWEAEIAACARDRQWERLTLTKLVHDIVRFLAERFRAQRGVMRALALHARSSPKSARLATQMESTSVAVHDLVVMAVLGKRAAITHPSADRAVSIGLATVMTMLRDQLVIQSVPRRRGHLPKGVLEHELARMLLSYLHDSRRNGVRRTSQRGGHPRVR